MRKSSQLNSVAENFCQVSALHAIAAVEMVEFRTAGGDPMRTLELLKKIPATARGLLWLEHGSPTPY